MDHPAVLVVRGKLEQCKGYWPEVAKLSGLSRSWLAQFVAGAIKNPGVQSLQDANDAADHVINHVMEKK
jgi:transcriptional regulator with XRE-family HTH domain